MTASRYEVQPIGTVESTLIDRATAPRQGTRSPDRPNPIGLHRVRIESIAGTRVRVSSLEALDGTPIVDVKPLLGPIDER